MCLADLVHCCLGYAKILDFTFLLEFLQLLPGVFDRDGAIICVDIMSMTVAEMKEIRERTRCW
jgi:hypothetical protein